MHKTALNSLAATYRMGSAQDSTMRRLAVRTFQPFLRADGSGLELGCSDGYMTEMLSQQLRALDVVEGAAGFIDQAKARKLANVTFHHALFEEFTPPARYDFISASYMLTHIEDTPALFKKIRAALKEDGLLFVVVPNNRVLSRQLALHMGLLDNVKTLTENDRNHGHVRTYDRVSLNRELERGGFSAIAEGGIMLKPLADFQMDGLMEQGVIGDAQVEGLYRLGLEYPDLCSALYSVCKVTQA